MQQSPGQISLEFMTVPSPTHPGYGKFDRSEWFQNYRNENISRMQLSSHEHGITKNVYTPCPDNLPNRYLKLPETQSSMIHRERHEEVDNFYIASQLHRDQYKDRTGSLHPLDYFKMSQYQYQCPKDPTTQYVESPKYYLKYRQPSVLPLPLERNMISLPDRALTGVYNKSSDMSYKN